MMGNCDISMQLIIGSPKIGSKASSIHVLDDTGDLGQLVQMSKP